jgi:peroxiredoxin
MKTKNSILIILIIIFLILNIFLFVRHQMIRERQNYTPPTELPAEIPGLQCGETAPAFTIKDLEGKPHSTDELKNKIAFLIFCEIKDEKSLMEAYYYKLLLGKYKGKGLVLWLISDAKDYLLPEDLAKIYSPILVLKDEDGKVTKAYCDKRIYRFQVYIVDRDGVIRFKGDALLNLLAKLAVEKFVLAKGEVCNKHEEFVNGANLPPFQYYDVKDGTIKKSQDLIGKSIFLTLYSANCPTCEEHRRLALMRSIYEKYSPQGLKVILLYGKDNPSNIIGDYVRKNKLPFDVGIREVRPEMVDDYYDNYDLEVDPKSIVINSKGKVVFVEGLKDKDTEEAIQKVIEDLFTESHLRK